MAVARDLAGGTNNVVAVIGDGALARRHGLRGDEQCGRAALAPDRGAERQRHVDRAAGRGALGPSLAAPVGPAYVTLRNLGRTFAESLPKPLELAAKRAEEFARGFVAGGTLFDELGFYYVGPVDGHNLDHLLPVLKNARDSQLDKPILVHVVTKRARAMLRPRPVRTSTTVS